MCDHQRQRELKTESCIELCYAQLNIKHSIEYVTVVCYLVDHLHDPDDGAPDGDGHAEDGAGGVTGLLVHRRVEPLVLPHVRHVQRLPAGGYVTGDSTRIGEPWGKCNEENG